MLYLSQFSNLRTKFFGKKAAAISNHTMVAVLILAITSLMSVSCSIDCESAKVGTVNFKINPENYIPYTDGQKISFVDSQNQDLVFIAKKTTGVSRVCTKFLCKGLTDPFGSAPCEFVEVPWINVEMRSEDQTKILSLGLYIDLFKSESMLFYDAISASYSDDANFASGHYGLDPHFTTPLFDRSQLPFADPITFEQSYTLGNKLYQSVYVAQSNRNKIFIQATKGIIGFEIDGQIFILK
jgi:hypothetical protein